MNDPMKINWKRMLRLAARLVVAAPAIKGAVDPVIAKHRHPKRDQGEGGHLPREDEIAPKEQSTSTRPKWPRAVAAAALLTASLVHGSAQAAGHMVGRVTSIHTHTGHLGLLVGITNIANPDACSGSGWLLLPETSERAEFSQAALLTAQTTGTQVRIWVDGCSDGYARIVDIQFDSHG